MSQCGSVADTVLETLTVPAGVYNVCKVTNYNEGTIVWIGDVPFGIVKLIVEKPGVSGALELNNIQNGQ